jgi:TRAP transporter TAXI family solute receptor
MLIGTSASSGTWLPLGVTFGELLGKYTNTNLTAQTTSGANENIRLVSKGDADMGVVTITNLVFEANLGAGSFEGNKIDNVRVLFGAVPNVVLIYARENSGIRTIRDMAGKKIGTGPAGQWCSSLFKWLVESYGMAGSVRELSMPWNDAYEAMGDGDMDGMFLQGGWPNSGIMNLAMNTKLRYIELTADEMAVLKSKDHTLYEQAIPGGIYAGLDNEYPSLANATAIVANRDMDDDVAYTIVKTIMEHAREYDSYTPLIPFIRPENAYKGVPPEDFHPGALRYFKEIGLVK